MKDFQTCGSEWNSNVMAGTRLQDSCRIGTAVETMAIAVDF
jgi:hypothetical protein